MSGNSWIAIGVGIVAGVAGFFTGGATWALFAFSVGSAAASMLLGPDTPKNGTTRPDEIQINQSAEDAVIPVIFGTTRLAANYIFVGFDKFKSTPIKQKSGSGKTKTKSTIGYRYTVPISYGICMGEIDALLRVFGSPGQDIMATFPGDGLTFIGGAPETIEIEFVKKEGDKEYLEGGSAVFYPGSATQGSATTTDKNHRGVCWVDFPVYTIDMSPSPRSLLFEMRRIPKTLDSLGATIAGFYTRAAPTSADPEYFDANPAAVAWEILQNPAWGKGMDADKMDAESFKKASVYYRENRIGYSSALGQGSLTETMGRLRDIFGLWVWWNGSSMMARCIHDLRNAYDYRPIIQADDIVGSPTFNRPSLSGTFNEIRLTFTNRLNNYQQEVATSMDLAHVETVGGIRSQSVDGAEIGTRRAAELLAHAMLRHMAYPAATCQVKVRRTYSGLQPGSFLQIAWDEWRQTSIANTFWRVVDIEDDDQGTEGITLTLMEDIYATAYFGEAQAWEDPSGTISNDDPLDDGSLVFGDLTGTREPGTLTPVILWEPNSFITGGGRAIGAFPTREKTYVQSVSVQFATVGSSETTSLGTASNLPFNGQLLDAIPLNSPTLSRAAANEFRVQLYHADQAATVAAATGLVQSDPHHFATLANGNTAIMLIGGEIFRVGFAEVTAAGVVTVRTYMRAEMGTIAALHPIGETACFFDEIDTNGLLDGTDLPITQAVNLYLTPNTTGNASGVTVTPAPANLLGYLFGGASIRPFEPEMATATRVGTTWTIRLRPRIWGLGAGTKINPQDDVYATVTDLTGLNLMFQKNSGGSTVTVPGGTSYGSPPFAMPAGISVDSLAWIPDDGAINSGTILAVVTFDINPTSLKIWGVRNGLASETALTILQPA